MSDTQSSGKNAQGLPDPSGPPPNKPSAPKPADQAKDFFDAHFPGLKDQVDPSAFMDALKKGSKEASEYLQQLTDKDRKRGKIPGERAYAGWPRERTSSESGATSGDVAMASRLPR